MAEISNFFKVNGAKEIARDLIKLSEGTQRKIVRPALTQGARLIGQYMKGIVPVTSGTLKRTIKWKIYTRGSGGRKAFFAKIGTTQGQGDKKNKKGVQVFKYAGKAEMKNRYLERALNAREKAAVQMLIHRTDIELKKFHSKGK